ncbi:Hypothetical protein NTJ_10392 [Nesidiocoris tenuis]|uniref:EB domain-containing protein n=1 Tax=Nesidiocoris tenuis TaxID=355587 RepID=A0ABN7B017_9HEMI|nr:Hypothetical protein NTJ_10392 [Nesidiocoris tenuis]
MKAGVAVGRAVQNRGALLDGMSDAGWGGRRVGGPDVFSNGSRVASLLGLIHGSGDVRMGGGLLIMLVLVYQGRAATTTTGSTTGPLHSASEETISTTTEEEPTGSLKFGDKCERTSDCGFRGAVCDESLKTCQCKPELTATNHIDKCGPEVDINGTCFFNEQCENRVLQTECRDGRCSCRFEMSPIFIPKHNKVECIAHYEPPEPETYVDPAMIMVLVGMALMFIIICVVLRLFAKARWRENRSIFNTPNPRLMNVSLLRETKPPGERRGSKGSNNRVPSRQPSMTSLRPQSPAAQSQGSRISSRGSRSSSGSVKSPTTHQQNHQPLNHDHHQQEKREDVDMQPNSVG